MVVHVYTGRRWRPARRSEVRRATGYEVWLIDDSGDGAPRFLARLAVLPSREAAERWAWQCGAPVALACTR